MIKKIRELVRAHTISTVERDLHMVIAQAVVHSDYITYFSARRKLRAVERLCAQASIN